MGADAMAEGVRAGMVSFEMCVKSSDIVACGPEALPSQGRRLYHWAEFTPLLILVLYCFFGRGKSKKTKLKLSFNRILYEKYSL